MDPPTTSCRGKERVGGRRRSILPAGRWSGTATEILEQVPEPSGSKGRSRGHGRGDRGGRVVDPSAGRIHSNKSCKAHNLPNTVVERGGRDSEPKGCARKMGELEGGELSSDDSHYCRGHRALPVVVAAAGAGKTTNTGAVGIAMHASYGGQAIMHKAPKNVLVVVVPTQAPQITQQGKGTRGREWRRGHQEGGAGGRSSNCLKRGKHNSARLH